MSATPPETEFGAQLLRRFSQTANPPSAPLAKGTRPPYHRLHPTPVTRVLSVRLSRLLLPASAFAFTYVLTACTAIQNELDRGFAYGMEAKSLTRKVDERRAPDKLPSGINAYLWRASLDTVKAIPLVTADAGKGMILTDWYSAPSDPDDRSQMRIEILDRDLRPDTLRVSVSRQVRQDGAWVDAPGLASSAQNIEENILVRARDIRGW